MTANTAKPARTATRRAESAGAANQRTMLTQVATGRTLLIVALFAGLVHAAMVFGPLARIEAIAGLVPFDLRPLGYSDIEARAILDRLGAEGRAIYLFRQIPLDMLYPPLLAATLSLALSFLAERLPRPFARLKPLIGLAWLGALADWTENGLVAALLWPLAADTELLVAAASLATIAKSLATTLVMVPVVIGMAALGAGRMWRWLRPHA